MIATGIESAKKCLKISFVCWLMKPKIFGSTLLGLDMQSS